MKNIFKLSLIMILAFGSLQAKAVTYSSAEVKAEVAKQVYELNKNYTDADLSVEVVTLPFMELDLPNGKVTYQIKPTMEKFMPRDLEKVSVYVNGKLARTFNAPVVVKAYQDILVASGFINIGQRITPSNVIVKRVETSNTLGYQLKSESLGKELLAKKAFREGEVIDKRFVKLKPDVVRNAMVTVLFNTNNLTITTEAIALSDGMVGDSICMINKEYNRTYKGKIIGENKVLVKI